MMSATAVGGTCGYPLLRVGDLQRPAAEPIVICGKTHVPRAQRDRGTLCAPLRCGCSRRLSGAIRMTASARIGDVPALTCVAVRKA